MTMTAQCHSNVNEPKNVPLFKKKIYFQYAVVSTKLKYKFMTLIKIICLMYNNDI